MNLYEFPTQVTKQNDSLVDQFVLMTAEMSNRGLVMFMTGFLVAKFNMFAESPQNYTLRENILKELANIERSKISRQDFLRGVILMLENNGCIEKIYQGMHDEEKPDRLNRLVMEQTHTPIKESRDQQNPQIRENSPKKELNRMMSEEQRIAEKMEKQKMRELTNKKAAQYQQSQDFIRTPKKNNIQMEKENLNELIMEISPEVMKEEQIQIKMLVQEQEEFQNALQAIADLEAQEFDHCSQCKEMISLQDMGRLECMHGFHRECMISLLQKSIEKKDPLRKCPRCDCRADISIEDVKMFIEGQKLDRYAELVVMQNSRVVNFSNAFKQEMRGENKEVKRQFKEQNENHANGKKHKKCPKCKTQVQIVSSSIQLLCNCGSMICLTCGGTWCKGNKCLYEEFLGKGSQKKPMGKK